MSDLATHTAQSGFEPDEETLISALRNQDDIPILMDVVTEQVGNSLSQADHLQHTLSDCVSETAAEAANEEDETLVEPPVQHAVSNMDVSAEQISQAVESVLQKRLPELVAEVLQVLKAPSEK